MSSDPSKNTTTTAGSNSPTVTKRATAAVTISDDERRRLAAFRDILSGSGGGNGGSSSGVADFSNSGQPSGDGGKATFGASSSGGPTTAVAAAAATATAKPKSTKRNDDSDEDDAAERQQMARNARAAWQQSTPDKGSAPEGASADIWADEQRQPGSQTAVFSNLPSLGAGGAAGGAGGDANDDDAQQAVVAHAPGVQRKLMVGQGTAAPAAMPEGRHLSVEAVPFVPRTSQHSAVGGRRAPPKSSQHANSSAAQEVAVATAQRRGELSTEDKPLDFIRWAAGGFLRGPVQDPAASLERNVPLWMHLAVLPPQCGQPSAKRVMRAWAVQFGLESVEYWLWRALVSRGVRVPIDCTEPDVLNHAPVYDFMKLVLKWYEKLQAYRDVKVVTAEDRALAEKLARKSHDEFVRYVSAYGEAAKSAFELFGDVIRDLEAAPAPEEQAAQ